MTDDEFVTRVRELLADTVPHVERDAILHWRVVCDERAIRVTAGAMRTRAAIR